MKQYFIDISKVLDTQTQEKFEVSIELEPFKLRATDIRSKSLSVIMTVDKFGGTNSDAVLVKGELSGVLILDCHRCLETFEHPINIKFKQIFAEDTEQFEESKHIIEGKIDIISLIIEILALKLPIKFLCSEDCAGICPGCGKNLNKEPCICEEKPVDARWQKLGDYFNLQKSKVKSQESRGKRNK